MSGPHGIGASPPRREDRRFLTGAGRFADDLGPVDAARAVVVRSPHPHARIRGIDAAAARAAPGVLAVLTAADTAGEIVRPIPSLTRTPPFDIRNRDGTEMPDASQWPLASDKARYLGEPVAFVVAETLDQARDAAERIAVDYDVLPAVIDLDDALAPGAAPLWDEHGRNVSFEWEAGDAARVGDALAGAAHVTRVTLVNNRIAPAFMEPRSALARHDAATGRYTLWTGSQGPHRLRDTLAEVLGLEPDRLRVVTPDTGGGFGARGAIYPEYALALVAARRTGRPVRWTAERAESFLSDAQARDHVLHGALALDADGRFTALEIAIDWRHGAYVPGRNIWVMVHFLPPTIGGVYRIPVSHLHLRGVFSNTTPQAAYRGIGRVEATYLIESLVDAAARETGTDRIALRRSNLVRPDEMPWTAPGGAVYGSGEFEANMDRALALAGWEGFEARRRAARAHGRERGIGLAMYVENDGGAPSEFAEVEARADGGIVARVGTQNFGMGHETMYAQVLSSELGIDFERVTVVDGDTDEVARGSGSHGSRSARIGGGALVFGARAMVERGRAIAAEMLEAAAGDLEYADGRYAISGTDRAVTLSEVAGVAERAGGRLTGEHDFAPGREAHSNGCQVCEVEVDPDTGRVTIAAHVVVADAGRLLNPTIVDGQLHGGAAQGLGQAALERVAFDPDTGQTLSGTFMDYAIPRANDLPAFTTTCVEVFEADNPLGVKGAGEGATTGAPAAFMNALGDALAALGAGPVDMPATPERVWQALLRRIPGSG